MDGVSLLNFIDAPCLVGDPEGRVVYVNPAFGQRFPQDGSPVEGVELVSLFEGGGREAILNAVAAVCSGGQTARFRLREGEDGFLGLCSPIEAPGSGSDRVGVVILLVDEPVMDAKLQAVQREIEEPLDEGIAALEQLIDQTGGRRSDTFRGAVERGLAALTRAKKWNDELHAALAGRSGNAERDARLDPVRLVREVSGRVGEAARANGMPLDLLVPAQLPAARGDADVLEAALVRLIRLRLATGEPDTPLTLAARLMGAGTRPAVLITLVDHPRGAEDEADEREPKSLLDAVSPYGGRVHSVRIPKTGRATAVRLPLAEG